MRQLIIFLPYLLVPLLVALSFMKAKKKIVFLSYIITVVVMIAHPIIFVNLEHYLYHSADGAQCGGPQTFFLIGSILFLTPVSFTLQILFNNLILKRSGLW